MSDEAVVSESPTLETPAVKETPAAASQKTAEEYAALISELERAGVQNPQQLDNKLKAAKEAGRLANMLGERNTELADMKAMLQEMQQSMRKPQRSSNYEEDAQPGAIDLGELVKKQVQSVIENEKRQSFEAQQRAFKAWQKIQSDEDYNLVASKWEAKMRDPNFAIQLQAGTIDPQEEYQQLLRNHYKASVKLAAETIKSLTSGNVMPQVHVENSARARIETPVERTEKQKQVDALKEKTNKGYMPTEDEELAALQAVLLRG